jgi:predicted nucleic acid-binding Zn ribbon protein
VKRLLGTGAGIIFKGSGFYATDYRTDSYQKGAAADKSESKSTTGSSKNESKKKQTKESAGGKAKTAAA